MDKPIEKSFDFAASVSKQLISLSTAVIAIILTFSKNLLGDNVGTDYNYWLIIAWGLFLLSTVFGIATLMALAGSLAKFQEPGPNTAEGNPKTIYGKNVTVPSTIQIFTFILALITSGIYGYLVMTHKPTTVPKDRVEKNLKVLRQSTYNFIDSVKTDTVYVIE